MKQQPIHDHIARVLTVIDGVSEEVVEVIEIPRFDLASFVVQFDVPVEHDPEMHDRYAVGPDDLAFLLGAIDAELSFDFSRYGYFIEACINE